MYEITDHILLEQASKDHQPDGSPYTGEYGTISEWAWVYALSHFKVGEQVEDDIFEEVVASAITQQILDSLIEKGLVEAIWNGKELVYRATQS